MSTFNGVVKEIPCLRIDRFDNYKEDTSIFLISHCHMDHMTGLNEEFLDMLQYKKQYLYGSPISVRILKNMYPDYEYQFKELFVNESILLTAVHENNGSYVTVLSIPANHCPGSVMFLLESNNVRILYTGDFRMENVEYFYNKYFSQYKHIDCLYLDTTFCKRQYTHFPTRKKSSEALCEVIENWLSLNPKNIVYLDFPARFGSESLFMDISKKTKQKIHVSPKTYSLHKFIPDMDLYVVSNDNNNDLRIHAYDCNSCTREVRNSIHICSIKITAFFWKYFELDQSAVECESVNKYRACASYHPSYHETSEFIRYLKPVDVEPCVVPKNEYEKKEMFKLIENMMEYKIKKRKPDYSFTIDPAFLNYTPISDNQSSMNDILSSPPRKC